MRFRFITTTFCCLFLAILALQAATFELQVSEQELPDGLSESVAAAVSSETFQVQSDQGPLFDFWFAPELDMGGENVGVFGIALGEIKAGSFVGVVRVHQGWMDYKNKPVRPGLYTIRYGLQPADGNHIGVSAFRDFCLLLPVAEDTDPTRIFDYQDLVKMASLASGTPHPSILGLWPLDEEVSQPKILENEEGQPMLALNVGSIGIGLVMEGHGEIAGY